jgi:arabinan endo-1,5-alpha-L-arabinosidase
MSRAPFLSLLSAAALALSALAVPATATGADADHYRNPLRPAVAGGGTVESCADPVVMRGRGEQQDRWYMFCTTDPLNDAETAPVGDPPFHPVPMLVSRDLVSWRYVGDALPQKPSWATETAGLWAPDLVYSRTTHRYYLTFVVTDTTDETSGEPGCDSDSALGVATSRNPTGPWKVSETPVVPPRRSGPACDFFWTYDPDVLGDSVGSHSVLYYGSYYGGVHVQRVDLTRGGMTTAGAPTMVAIGNRYEGTNVVRRDGWYYFFGSATNCCNGPLTGYSVFAGRSRSPLGPFVDREGNSLLSGRVGGTPAISMNGNRWVGTGHSSAFRDRAGRWWMAYHAVDRNDPYFEGEPGFTKRPALLDPLTWRGGWPSVRAGRWASDQRMPAPAAQRGERDRYRPDPVPAQRPGHLLPRFSDDFGGSTLDDSWSWVRQPSDSTTYGVAGGRFRFDVQTADLYVDSNDASVLTRPAPARDFVVETRVSLDVPPEGCCYNFAQAGLVLYGSDDSFVKLADASLWETRQTEWAKEVPSGTTRYGNTVVGPPGDDTWLRIVRQTRGGRQLFTAYTSQDGSRWVRGGTWTHDRLGDDLRIGLVSMGKTPEVPDDITASFDYVRTWTLRR